MNFIVFVMALDCGSHLIGFTLAILMFCCISHLKPIAWLQINLLIRFSPRIHQHSFLGEWKWLYLISSLLVTIEILYDRPSYWEIIILDYEEDCVPIPPQLIVLWQLQLRKEKWDTDKQSIQIEGCSWSHLAIAFTLMLCIHRKRR